MLIFFDNISYSQNIHHDIFRNKNFQVFIVWKKIEFSKIYTLQQLKFCLN